MTTRNASNGWRWVGLIVLLLILLTLWAKGRGPSFSGSQAGCCGVVVEQAEQTGATAPAPQSVVNFALKAENGKVTLTGNVPSEAERKNTVNAAAAVFGEGNVIDRLTIKEDVSLPGWWDKLGDALAWAKSGTGYGLNQQDNTVVLTGTVSSDVDKAARQADVSMPLGPHLAIDNQIAVERAPASAALEVPPCSGDMNVAISFASGSARLSTNGKKQLDQIAPCISASTEVGGYTDDVGDDVLNNKLSKARADAVVAYMTSIDAAKGALLTAVGYGESKPVADNATEEGRAQNRRIEFVAK